MVVLLATLIGIIFVLLSVNTTYNIIKYKNIAGKMDAAIKECREMIEADRRKKSYGTLDIEYETACKVLLKLVNPTETPVITDTNGKRLTAEVITYLLNKVERDKCRWYKDYTI